MYRRFSLLAVSLAMLAFPLGAGAQNQRGAVSTKTYVSRLCAARVNAIDPTTWACTKIIVPLQMVAGQTATVTFAFRAKIKLKNVEICFSQIASAKAECAYHRKYATIQSGYTIKRILHMAVPMVAKSGTYAMDNYSRFFLPPKNFDKSLYWEAYSFVNIEVPAA